jgi:hypothetical protein
MADKGTGQTTGQLEYSWYLQRMTDSNLGPGTPLNTLKMTYYGQESIGGDTLAEKERNWLRKVIVDGGNTPQGNALSDLWKQACAAKGAIVGFNVPECKRNFFTHVDIDIRTLGTGGWGIDQFGLFQWGLTNFSS